MEPYSPEFLNCLAKTYPTYPTGRNVVPSPSITGERPRIVVKVTPKRKSSQKDPTPEKRMKMVIKTKKPMTTTTTTTTEQPMTTTTTEQPRTTTTATPLPTTAASKPPTTKRFKTISSDFGSLPMIELGTPVGRNSIAAQTGTKGAGYRSIETQSSPSREIQIVEHSWAQHQNNFSQSL